MKGPGDFVEIDDVEEYQEDVDNGLLIEAPESDQATAQNNAPVGNESAPAQTSATGTTPATPATSATSATPATPATVPPGQSKKAGG